MWLCALQGVEPSYIFPKVIANTKLGHLRQFTQRVGQTGAVHFESVVISPLQVPSYGFSWWLSFSLFQ